MTRHYQCFPIRVIHSHGCLPPSMGRACGDFNRLPASPYSIPIPIQKEKSMIFEPAGRSPLPTKDLLSYIFDNPPYDQDDPIYIDPENPSRSISCNQARTLIRQLVAGLWSWGVRKGDCVALHSFNDIYYSILVLAIVGAGGVYTGTNPAYTEMELQHHFTASQTRFLISEPEILGPLMAAAKHSGIPESNIRVFNVFGQAIPSGMRAWDDLLKAGEEDWVRFDDLESVQKTTAARLFSSGTTGLPKATIITHYNMIAQHELVYEVHPRPYQICRVIPTPVFHAAAAPTTHFGAVRAGYRTFVMRRFDMKLFLETIEKYNATDLTLVPPIALAILTSPYSKSRPFLKKLKTGICGAAPLGKDVQARFHELMADDAPLTQVWGMTETSFVATCFPYPEQDDTGSVGRLIPNLEAKLIDTDGNNVSAHGVRGELCVRGPTVTPGYFNNEEANAASFDSDGWFKTGDIAYCDEATHKWYIVDRRKELIKVRGFQVAPAELEAVLLLHPRIIDAAVIGISFPGSDDEFPRAYVVRRPTVEGQRLNLVEVQQYLADRLAKYKALTGGATFVDVIPKNASGKILKKVLKEISSKEIDAGMVKPKL